MNSFDDDEITFDFFAEPETVETVKQRRRLPRLQPFRGHGGDRGRRRPSPPPGLVGIRRLAGLATAVIVAVVALVSAIGACQGAGNGYAGYLGEARRLAQSSSRAGAELANDLGPSRLKSSDLARRLQNLAAQEQQAYDQAQQIRPPGPLRQVHQELLAALELRATGLVSLGQALASAESKKTAASSAADALAAQARLLTTSDVVWDQLYRIPAGQQLRAHGITGLVVPHSRFVLNPALVGAPSFAQLLQRLQGVTNASAVPLLLKSGASGDAVAAWQRQLNRWLHTQPGRPLLPVTGTFGPLTEAATRALQQATGITDDGTVGPATRQALTRVLAGIK